MQKKGEHVLLFNQYFKIIARHQFLDQTIGTTSLEKTAMANLSVLVFSPILAVVGAVFQIGFMWIFDKFGHPWKRFLDLSTDDFTIPDSEEDYFEFYEIFDYEDYDDDEDYEDYEEAYDFYDIFD